MTLPPYVIKIANTISCCFNYEVPGKLQVQLFFDNVYIVLILFICPELFALDLLRGLAHYLWMYGLTFLLSDWIVFPFNYWKNDASRWICITISRLLYSFSEFKRKNAAKKTATIERWTWEEKKAANKDSQQKSRKKADED